MVRGNCRSIFDLQVGKIFFVLIVVFLVPGFGYAAPDNVVWETETDWEAAELNNIEVFGTGEDAFVQLPNGTSELSDEAPSGYTEIEDWNDLADLSENGEYALVSDLNEDSDGYDDLASSSANNGDGWEQIEEFTGTFDGQGYTISDLRMDRLGDDYKGLFGEIEDDATIRNLTIRNADMRGGRYFGVLVGYFDGEDITIEDVNIDNSTIESDSERAGLLIGDTGTNVSGVVENIHVAGKVDSPEARQTGGLAGRIRDERVEILDSSANVTVIGDSEVGGLVGENDGVIERSYAIGNVTGMDDNVGGLVGDNADSDAVIRESFASGNVISEEDDTVGGLVGVNDGLIIDSYALGDAEGHDEIGGLLGVEDGEGIETSYSIGEVIGEDDIGGLLGVNGEDSVVDSYWDINTSDKDDSAAGVGLTTDEMQGSEANGSMEFDFNEWFIVEEGEEIGDSNVTPKKDGYPILRNVSIQAQLEEQEIDFDEIQKGNLVTDNRTMDDVEPNLVNLSYSLEGGSVTVDVIGSPNTSDEETETQKLEGDDDYNLEWGESHDEFKLDMTLETEGEDSPTVNRITLEEQVAENVSVDVQPEDTKDGDEIIGPPTALVEDEFGQPVENNTVTVSVNDSEFTSGETSVETDSDGLAEFDDLVMNDTGSYELTFDAENVDQDTETDPFNVNPPDADSVNVSVQPEDSFVGQEIDGPPTVLVEDESDEPVEDIEVDVEINDSEATLDGDITVSTNEDGLAKFDNISVEDFGVYELSFDAENVDSNVSTNSFEVVSNLRVNNIELDEDELVEGEDANVTVEIEHLYDKKLDNVELELSAEEYTTEEVWNQYFSETIKIDFDGQEVKTKEFSVTPKVGPNRLNATIDPEDEIPEENRDENTFLEISDVSSYTILYGGSQQTLKLGSDEKSVNSWSSQTPEGNIFIKDADASFHITELDAPNNQGDLELIDEDLEIEHHNDSISQEWDQTRDGFSDENATFEIAGNTIEDVPVVNSTITEDFQTGILYDTSQGTPYDGSQNLVFVTEVNTETQGEFGIYDYEARVPTSLSTQAGPRESVELITELN